MKKIVIIGAGFGGLAAGIRLAARGYKTIIYDKSPYPGGVAGQIKENGYIFDAGPTIITAPDLLKSLFRSAGKELSDYVELQKLYPFYRMYFHDNTFIDYSGNEDAMRAQMGAFEPQDALNYISFLNHSKNAFNAVIHGGLGSSAFNSFSKTLRYLPKALKHKTLHSSYSLASKYFSDFRHRLLFSFQPLFIGGNPFKTPSFYSMMSYLEKQSGVYYPKGGVNSIIQAMASVYKDLGGELKLSAEVDEIIVEKRKAIGVVSGYNFEAADIIISAGDVFNLYSKLINSRHRKTWTDFRLESTKISMSAFMLYLGVNKKFSKLLHHNIILSPRYKGFMKDVFVRKNIPDDLSLYVNVPSKTDESMAPEGCDSITVMAPVANLQNGANWNEIKENFASRIINFLEQDFGLEGLRESVQVKKIYTPLDYLEHKNCGYGSPWGIQPLLSQSAYFRPHSKSEDIDNLFLAGAGAHPGAGIPATLMSSEIAENLITKYIARVLKENKKSMETV